MGAPQEDNDVRQTLKIVTYIFAGLSMMLNIRLCYSAAPYALLRFKLPENLFSIFVRKMASALELWCLPSMFLGNFIELTDKYVSGGHERRRFSDAPKYDVNDKNLGEGLRLKAEELEIAATTLKDKATNESVSNLTGPAGTLATAARTLAKNNPANASGNATNVINNYKLLDDAYDGLNAEKDKVKSEFNTVKHIYDRMLNVTKAKLLKDQVGDRDAGNVVTNQKIWYHANQLHEKANLLATASNLEAPEDQGAADTHKDLRDLAETLKNATDDRNGLQKALKELSGATQPSDIVEKAQDVITKYNKVESAFKAVTDKEARYQEALKGALGDETSKYDGVKSQFTELKGKFDAAKCNAIVPIYDKPVIRWSSIFWTWANFFTFVILFFVFITGGEQGHVTLFYWVIAASGFVFGIYMVFVYAMEWWFFNWYMVGENSFPVVTSFMHYVSILIFGNRRKWNTDYIAVIVDMVISMCIALIAAVLWTYCYVDPPPFEYDPPSSIEPAIFSPVLMVLVGMGIVYAIYPAIAPGMIVPFYLIDKIEMVLLIMTCFPPVIVAIVCREKYANSPKAKWTTNSVPWPPPVNNTFWHTFIFIPPLQICLTVVLLYSLHYRDSSIARSIINQPKMSTFLSILFYMCHEIQLALGFPGIIGNKGENYVILPVQYVGALLMVFLAFYSEGYITEYKRYYPSHWPTEGMTKWNAFCYWCKRASKITDKFFKNLRYTLLFILLLIRC